MFGQINFETLYHLSFGRIPKRIGSGKISAKYFRPTHLQAEKPEIVLIVFLQGEGGTKFQRSRWIPAANLMDFAEIRITARASHHARNLQLAFRSLNNVCEPLIVVHVAGQDQVRVTFGSLKAFKKRFVNRATSSVLRVPRKRRMMNCYDECQIRTGSF